MMLVQSTMNTWYTVNISLYTCSVDKTNTKIITCLESPEMTEFGCTLQSGSVQQQLDHCFFVVQSADFFHKTL